MKTKHSRNAVIANEGFVPITIYWINVKRKVVENMFVWIVIGNPTRKVKDFLIKFFVIFVMKNGSRDWNIWTTENGISVLRSSINGLKNSICSRGFLHNSLSFTF